MTRRMQIFIAGAVFLFFGMIAILLFQGGGDAQQVEPSASDTPQPTASPSPALTEAALALTLNAPTKPPTELTRRPDFTRQVAITQTAYALTDPALEGIEIDILSETILNTSDNIVLEVVRFDPVDVIASYSVLIIDSATDDVIEEINYPVELRDVQSLTVPEINMEEGRDTYYVVVALDANGEVITSFAGIPNNTSDDLPTMTPSVIDATFSAQSADTPTPLPVTEAPPGDVARERDEIGDGEVFLYYDKDVEPDTRVVVQLEVFFRNLYITATPTSPVTVVAITPFSSPPPVDMAADDSPPVARLSDEGILLYPRMVAELECFDGFTNCGEDTALRMQINRINTFSWSIVPVDDGTTGRRNLEITLYNADEDGQRVGAAVWRQRFNISVGGASAAASPLPLLIAGGLAVIFIVAVGWSLRRKRPTTTGGAEIPAGERPTAFVSYRRSVSWGIARTIVDRLESKGVDVFIDVEDIHDGSFGEYIQQNIRNRDYFIPVLAPGTLESEWVRREILLALTLEKTIIPVMVNGFDLYTHPIPDDLQAIKEQNGVILPPEYVDAGIDRIAKYMGV